MTGKFLSVEGIDGSGKSTAIALLAEQLEKAGYDVVVLREPGGTTTGEKIRSILLDKASDGMTKTCELLLFAAARSELTKTVIRPALEDGKIVICDRFIDSTVAYQGYGRGLDEEMIDALNQMATEGLKPDRTFWLDIDVELAAKRLNMRLDKTEDRLDAEGLSFQEKVRQGYQVLEQRYQKRILRLDAKASPNEIVNKMQDALREDWKL